MADTLTIPEPVIKIDGKALSNQTMLDMVDLSVDMDYFLPTMLSIRLKDSFNGDNDSLAYADTNTFKLGAAVVIDINADLYNEEVKQHLFKGEITGIEHTFAPDGNSYISIRAYDRSYRLMQGKNSRNFGTGDPNAGMESKDIVKKIASENGLQATTDSDGIKHTFIIQYNESDWDFLWKLARMGGFQLYVDNKTLHYHKLNAPRGSSRTTVELNWGESLTTFEPRVSVMGQISEATAMSWNDQKKVIKGVSKSTDQALAAKIGIQKTGGATLKGIVSKTPAVASPLTELATQPQSKQIAEGEMALAESNFIQADGYCLIGDPRIIAGKQIKISNVGKRYTGTYTVTKALHTWRNGLYSVQFSVSGSAPHTIRALLQPDGPRDMSISGMVRAKITNINDPDKLGRVKINYPWISAEMESGWVRIANPGGGKDRGLFFTPEVNDEVLVGFEFGDLSAPYIVGSLWNRTDKPPKFKGEAISGGKVDQRIIRSRSGHLIILNDKQGEEQIIIQDKTTKNSLVISSKDNSITLKSSGDFTIEAGGKFIVKSTGDMTMDTKANSSIKCMQSFSVDSKKDAVVKVLTNQLSLKAAGAELSGMKVDVKASTMASITASAMVEVKGALVKIN